MAPGSLIGAWQIGLVWLGATLTFEFIAGHYLFRNPWQKILADYNPLEGRLWLLVPIVTLVAPPLWFKGLSSDYWIPYLVSSSIALITLGLALGTWRAASRWLIALILGYAAVHNWLVLPEAYQGFADLTILPAYRDIIVGPFRHHAAEYLRAIAIGQGIIAVALALGGRYLVVGVVGTCVFLTAIIPLGIGSAFPFSALVSLAALVNLGPRRNQPT
jgi:hypothetical protein